MRLLLLGSLMIACGVAAACSSSDTSSSGPAVTPTPPPTPPGTTPTPNPPPVNPPPPPPPATGVTFTADEIAAYQKQSPLPAVPADPTNAFADVAAAAVLGQRLFWDKSYSGALAVGFDATNGGLGTIGEAGKVACVSCHGSADMDDLRSNPNNVSLGTDYGTRNALPVVNASFYKWTNWAGRFDSQWSLPPAVAENAKIMNSSRLAIAHMLWDKYKDDYDAIFPVALDASLDPGAADAARFPATGKPGVAAWDAMAPADQAIVNRIFANYGKAIAAYMRLVVSRDAAFDRFVAGDATAIDDSAKRGLKIFLGKGKCVGCHTGPNFADDDFHDLGVPQTGTRVPATDLGRYTDVAGLLSSPFNTAGTFSDDTGTGKLTGLTQTAAQTALFRTKSLRNLSSSAPYMHSGQFAKLEDVVDFYDSGGGGVQDGGAKDPKLTALGLAADEKADLVAFLKTLEGAPVAPALLLDISR